MNNLRFIILSIVGTCLVAFSSCNKNDSPYYDYENVVQSYNGTALEYLKSQPSGTFDSLLLVLDRYPQIQDTLSTQAITLFAPVNANFASAIKYLNITRRAQGKEELYLNTVDIDALEQLICKYIIRGNRNTDDYKGERDGLLLNSIIYNYPMHVKYVQESSSGFMSGGASVLNFSNPFGSVFVKDWIITSTKTVNIKTNNATINILTPIHNLGFDQFTEMLND